MTPAEGNSEAYRCKHRGERQPTHNRLSVHIKEHNSSVPNGERVCATKDASHACNRAREEKPEGRRTQGWIPFKLQKENLKMNFPFD